MWITQFRALAKGSEEQLQGSEDASQSTLGLEGQEGLAQVEQQAEVFQVASQLEQR